MGVGNMFRKPLYVPLCGGKNNRVLQTFPERNPLTDARILQSTDRIRCEPGILHASNPPPCLNRGVLNQKRPPNRLLVREFYVHNSFHPNTPCATKQMLQAGYHGPIVDFGLPHRNLGVVVGERFFFAVDPSPLYMVPASPKTYASRLFGTFGFGGH